MFSMLFAIVIFYSHVVIPKLQAVFSEFSTSGEMPIQTRLLVAFSDFISNYWAYIGAVVFLVPFVLFMLHRKNRKARFAIDSLLLKIPFISTIIIRAQLSRFCLFVANVYDKGYNFLDSIAESTIVLTNAKMYYDMENMIDNIKSGEAVYRALRQIPYIPRFTHRMFRVAELTSNVSRPLNAVYNFYAQEVENDLEKVLRFVKPVAILLIGFLMLWIISATLLPFYARIPQLLGGANV
jgi:type IV pilus assembly protein PilC